MGSIYVKYINCLFCLSYCKPFQQAARPAGSSSQRAPTTSASSFTATGLSGALQGPTAQGPPPNRSSRNQGGSSVSISISTSVHRVERIMIIYKFYVIYFIYYIYCFFLIQPSQSIIKAF